RNGSGTCSTISGSSQYVNAWRCGAVRYRSGLTVTPEPVAEGRPARTSRMSAAVWVGSVERTAIGPAGRPPPRTDLTLQIWRRPLEPKAGRCGAPAPIGGTHPPVLQFWPTSLERERL